MFAIAAVVNHFSDALIENPIVGQASENPDLREWHTNKLDRLPRLKFMRTLWVCNVAGGPFTFSATKPGSTAQGLEEAHREFRITPEEFDEGRGRAGTLARPISGSPRVRRTKSWRRSRRKGEVTEGSMASA